MIWLDIFLGIVAVAALSAGAYFFVQHRHLLQRNLLLSNAQKLAETRITALENEIDALNNEAKTLLEQNATLKTSLDYEQRFAAERQAAFMEMKEQSKNEFKVLSQSILEERLKIHKQSQEENLNVLLKPLERQIEGFRKKVEEVYEGDTKGRSEILSEIRHLKTLNDRISQDAINLTNALKGNNKAQGDWGEMVLENLLEDSGLTKNREYFVQENLKGENGANYRPDVTVKLPNGKKIIIDSKVSLKDYERYINEKDAKNAEKNDALIVHITSLKNHIKALSQKDYTALLSGAKLDFVLMFVPLEGAFLEAMKCDSELFSYAYNKNIILVSPTTLYATLRTIENIWRNEHQINNIEEILRVAGALYDKFLGFYESLEGVGKSLESAKNSYKDSLDRLKDGRGSIVSQIQRLESLGVKGKKRAEKNALKNAEKIEFSEDSAES